jgi:hypothetical protein
MDSCVDINIGPDVSMLMTVGEGKVRLPPPYPLLQKVMPLILIIMRVLKDIGVHPWGPSEGQDPRHLLNQPIIRVHMNVIFFADGVPHGVCIFK